MCEKICKLNEKENPEKSFFCGFGQTCSTNVLHWKTNQTLLSRSTERREHFRERIRWSKINSILLEFIFSRHDHHQALRTNQRCNPSAAANHIILLDDSSYLGAYFIRLKAKEETEQRSLVLETNQWDLIPLYRGKSIWKMDNVFWNKFTMLPYKYREHIVNCVCTLVQTSSHNKAKSSANKRFSK